MSLFNKAYKAVCRLQLLQHELDCLENNYRKWMNDEQRKITKTDASIQATTGYLMHG